jgi:hypothetical protein
MNPRKVGAPDKEANIVDDFGSEERVLEHLTQSWEMFPLESRQTGAAQRTAVLDFDEMLLIQPPAPATAPSTARTVSATRLRPRRSILRSVGAVGMVAVSIALAVIGGAAVRNRLDLSVLSDYLTVVRTSTPAPREVPPPAKVVRDSAVAGSTTGTTDSPPAGVAVTNSVAAEKEPENVKVAAPRSRQTTTLRPPARAALPSPRPPASSAVTRAAASPATPPAVTTIERGGESPPPATAVTVMSPAPAVPAVSSAPAAPAVSSAPAAPALGSPAAPAPVTPPSASPAGALTAETRAVAVALNRYQDAFSALDANAAHAVWPSVDVKALAKAFDQLEAQTFDLEGCNITVAGARAEADCAGNARYVRKVGNRALRVEPRRWHFTLRQTNDQWIIDAVDAR